MKLFVPIYEIICAGFFAINCKVNARRSVYTTRYHLIITWTDVTDATLGASGLWLGARTVAHGTYTLA